MKAKRTIAIAALLATLGGGGFLLTKRDRVEASVPNPAVRAIELAAGETVLVRPTDLREAVRLSGSLQPMDQTMVKAEVAATLSEVLVREGQAVAKGALLARFDPSDLQARLNEKISNLEGAKAQLALSARTRANNQTLRAKGIVAETAYDQAESNYRYNQATAAALEAQVALARKALADAVVRAPIAGVIAERAVNPGESLAQNAKLFTIVDLTEMQFVATVTAASVPRIKVGQTVTVHVEGFGEREFRGTVARISPTTQAGSRSIPVYVVLKNPDGALKGGMFASGEVTVAEAQGAVAVPASAVRRDSDGAFVLKVVNDTLLRQPVTVAETWSGGELVQLTGVNAGDVVVSGPLPGLRAGQAVRLAKD